MATTTRGTVHLPSSNQGEYGQDATDKQFAACRTAIRRALEAAGFDVVIGGGRDTYETDDDREEAREIGERAFERFLAEADEAAADEEAGAERS